jgi:hypothetical protein
MPKAPTKAISPIYQLKITLRGLRPPIWRRVLVPGSFSLLKLHEVIQAAMGWYDCHLHLFVIDGEFYSVPSPDDLEEFIDERRFTIQKIAPAEKRKFRYDYDFGDSWEHDILVEKIIPPEAGATYPVCITGKRACPPEDVGGTWGYAEFLEAMADPEHEEHDSYLEWVGDEFDPETFDIEQVNELLKEIK